ncbi:TetR/AcrR family transcriptional regulator [Paenibacillus sp. L3-i20]|uniref:TetR/AcrR family transcriptional regulator n=1 Tax=Paenibacillus sp. L3-i20 TaxID=2905833 RepID=UPI001EDF0C54|nr:TetR/AcrR family transcriptional regulator [Paenibacillus sp. L3-i20]GKU76918.1 TetR family transcriptional regulator [Paenibacillus sp. L3-i20]
MNKKQIKSIETKANILEAANTLFSSKGYHAASIEDIATLTGTSKANIYYHFKSKEGLIFSLLEQSEAEWRTLWNEQRSQYNTITDLLYNMIDISLKRNLHHPLNRAMKEFVDDNLGKDGEATEKLNARFEEKRLFYTGILQEGMDSGEFKSGNPALLSQVFESLFRGLYESTQQMNLEESLLLYRTALDTFFKGISAER